MERLSDKDREEIHKTLRDLRSTQRLESSDWLSSCLVRGRRQEEPNMTRYEALKEIFGEVLETVEKESPDYADLLRGRFWEGHTVDEMVEAERPWPGSVSNFYNHQREAIQRFALLLWEKEQICKHNLTIETEREELQGVSKTDQLRIHTTDDSSTAIREDRFRITAWITKYRWVVIIVLVLVVLSIIGQTFTQFLPSTLSLFSQSIPTASSTLGLPTQSVGFVCGESNRVETPSADRFLRSQGVSAFTVENTQGAVLNNHVRAIVIDSHGLWIGYFATDQNSSNGLGHYDKKSWANCNHPEGTAGKNINSITIDKIGRVWIALEKAGVAMFDGKNWVVYTADDGLPSNDVFKITVDKDNNIWVGTWEGVAKFNGKIWNIPYTIQNNTLYDNHVQMIVFDSVGNIWIGHTSQGVSQFRKSDGKWVHHAAQANGLEGNEIRGIVARKAMGNSPESIWFATADGGISKFEQDSWSTYRIRDGLPSNDVEAIAIDKHNRIWAATTRGVVYFDGKKWITYDTINTLSIAFGPSCQSCPFDDDNVWTGTIDSGLTHSRVPYPEEAIDVIRVEYPKVVAPGEKFSPEITVVPRATYQLREDRGDFLAVTNENDIALFGVHPLIGVTGVVDSGQPFKFVDHNKPVIAPQLAADEQEKVFTITYRVWMHTRYTGPYIPITFTIRRP